jgi:hypothetical protein
MVYLRIWSDISKTIAFFCIRESLAVSTTVSVNYPTKFIFAFHKSSVGRSVGNNPFCFHPYSVCYFYNKYISLTYCLLIVEPTITCKRHFTMKRKWKCQPFNLHSRSFYTFVHNHILDTSIRIFVRPCATKFLLLYSIISRKTRNIHTIRYNALFNSFV